MGGETKEGNDGRECGERDAGREEDRDSGRRGNDGELGSQEVTWRRDAKRLGKFPKSQSSDRLTRHSLPTLFSPCALSACAARTSTAAKSAGKPPLASERPTAATAEAQTGDSLLMQMQMHP